MLPVRSMYVPRFGSQRGSSQRDEPQPDQTDHFSRDKRGNKRSNVRGEKTNLKVKLPKVNNSTLSNMGIKQDKTKRWTKVAAANKSKTTVSQRGADSDSVVRDVFFFSERPTSTAINEKEKAKLAVLRTISKMLEENQLIRQRLAAVSQAN